MFEKYIKTEPEEQVDDTVENEEITVENTIIKETNNNKVTNENNEKETVDSKEVYDFPIPEYLLPWKNDETLLIEYTRRLVNAGYDNIDLIASATVGEMVKKTGINEYLIKELINNALQWSAFNFKTASSLYSSRSSLKKIPIMCNSLDKILNGGVEPKAITEFYGEFITGKTQICLQLAISATLPEKLGGLDAKAIYIDTEGSFNPERLVQILSRWDIQPDRILDRIIVGRAFTSDIQIAMIDNMLEIIKEKDTKLLIIDSLTSNFRSEYMGKDAIYDRQQKLNKHIQQLSRIADIHDIAVVITNQVMSDMDQSNNVKPIGGNILAHGSTHRIECSKSQLKSTVRFAKIVASPSLPDAKATFEITKHGIEDV